MSVIATIAAQRQKLLDGIAANDGDINLRIFEDFYPDEAHFIYELLQNAEDAGATEVLFELYPDRCVFEHNGTRHFDERDIRAITGIFNSSKKESTDKIGKFGVGFKSVFVYTDTPIIHSKHYSFEILKLVLPREVPATHGLGERTRFEFPFNNAAKEAKAAFAEVQQGLEQLSETTLLYLTNLRYIRWKVGPREGAILREEHSESHVEVLKQLDGKEVMTSHWLRFAEPIQDVGKFTAPAEGVVWQKVAIAFELALLAESKSFDKAKPLSKQMKIVPAVKGTVSVFFPADKESSGLRFHLHGPFVPELSRASIKNTPENLPLFDQLAKLTAKSLHSIRDAGLLSGEFLAVLPNNDDPLPERYVPIRKAILDEMRREALVPSYNGRFAPASRLVQARASLKALLSAEDLALATGRADLPEWVIGATQRNSNQDRLLGSLGIPNWDADMLKGFFERRSREPKGYWSDCEVDQAVIDWVASKSFEWLQALYSVLQRHCEESDDYGDLGDVYFLRLTSGEISTGAFAYFQTGPVDATDPLCRVDQEVLTAGTKKSQQEDARRFLERIGVREPNEEDELRQLLLRRYGPEGDGPADKVYLADFKKMMAFAEKHQDIADVFRDAYIFKVASPSYEWTTPASVFIDQPFSTTYLARVYELVVDEDRKKWPLSDWYLQCGIPLDRLVRFAVRVGCESEFDDLCVEAECSRNPSWNYLRGAPGQRAGNVIDRDFALSRTSSILIEAKRPDASLLIWQALCNAERAYPSPLKARFQWTDKGGPRDAASQLVWSLKARAWVPQQDGSFVKPSSARADQLPKGFTIDAGYKWLEALGFGAEEKTRATETAARASRREELGFESEDELQRALAFVRQVPEDEQRRILAVTDQRADEPVELPERPVNNPELRRRRVSEEARRTPDKDTAVLERSVQLGAAEAKAQAKLYLMDQYTNSKGQMVCQVCKGELPFKLPTGSYYFEAVEVLAESPKRYREAYLALCPNHSAAYQYANAHRNQMQELIETASGSEIEVALGGAVTTIYFTQMHLADLRACLEEEQLVQQVEDGS
jgi:hypothetical protein